MRLKKLFSQFNEEDLVKFRKSFVKAKLRAASFAWPFRTLALKRARVIRGLYECALCKKQIKSSEVELDHVEPIVIPEEGFVSWDKFIARLFVGIEGWQILCHECHNKKTFEETEKRTIARRKKKEEGKKS